MALPKYKGKAIIIRGKEGFKLEFCFGNSTVEKIFFVLYAYGEAYPLGMTKLFGVPLNSVQQLKSIAKRGIVSHRLIAKIRLSTVNSHCPLLRELTSLIEKSHEFLREREKNAYYRVRTRPRRAGTRR
jgi:hypothetical protein